MLVSQQRFVSAENPTNVLLDSSLDGIPVLASRESSPRITSRLFSPSGTLALNIFMQSKAYKRFRMQMELRHAFFNPPSLPEGYRFLPWRSLLLERHANVKWRSFRDDLDGQVFACLGQSPGCLALMKEIVSQRTFCPAATWMVVYQPEPDWPAGDCGTIQGITRNGGIGAIQNVGVTPEHRGQGIGRALVIQALRGFLQCGMACSVLEVTAENEVAVKLYRSIGFEIVDVLYRDSATGETVSEDDFAQSRRRWYSSR